MIKGKVVKILNEYQLVLNVGFRHGAQKGMHFVIYDEGEEIVDPGSGESLGTLEIVKAEVELVHVQESMSTAQPKEEKKTGATPTVLSARLQEISTLGRGGQERESLNVKQTEISGVRTASQITVGDLVRSVEEGAM